MDNETKVNKMNRNNGRIKNGTSAINFFSTKTAVNLAVKFESETAKKLRIIALKKGFAS